VAQKDGGSAETDEKAFVSLCNAVDEETESLDPVEQADRDKWAKAERKNDQAGCL
jgi:hypothetical protein